MLLLTITLALAFHIKGVYINSGTCMLYIMLTLNLTLHILQTFKVFSVYC